MTEEQSADVVSAMKAASELVDAETAYEGPLWHYTTAAGVRAILESGKIWASDADYLNDPSELHVLSHTVTNVAKYRNAEKPGPYTKIAVDLMNKFSNLLDTTYVVSFSSVNDDLSQWRAYAEDGAGYAIRFEPSRLAVDGTSYLVRCQYLSDEQLVERAVAILDGAERHSIELGSATTVERAAFAHEKFIQTSLMMSAAFIKLPAYEGEREVRLTSPGGTRSYGVDSKWHYDERQVHLRKNMFVPHVSVDVGHAIRSVMIGPKASPDLARYRYGLRSYLDSVGRGDLDIEMSKHPYRE